MFKMSQNPWTDLVNKETGRPCFLNPFDPNPPRMAVKNEFMENPFEKVLEKQRIKNIKEKRRN